MKESNIYPGTYKLLPEVELFLQQFRSSCQAKGECLPAIVEEIEGCYHLNMAIPGLKKEDILIHSHGNTLSVVIIPKSGDMPKTNYEEKRIILPEDADTEFISATYKEGLLHLCIPKATNHSLVSDLEVIVY